MISWLRFPVFFSVRDADALVQARRVGKREGEDRGIAIGRRMVLNDFRHMLDEYEERLQRGRISDRS